MRSADAAQPGALRLLRRPDVEARTGLRRSTLYLYMSLGTFPSPIHLGGRSVAWVEAEVDLWIATRIAESRAAPTTADTAEAP